MLVSSKCNGGSIPCFMLLVYTLAASTLFYVSDAYSRDKSPIRRYTQGDAECSAPQDILRRSFPKETTIIKGELKEASELGLYRSRSISSDSIRSNLVLHEYKIIIKSINAPDSKYSSGDFVTIITYADLTDVIFRAYDDYYKKNKPKSLSFDAGATVFIFPGEFIDLGGGNVIRISSLIKDAYPLSYSKKIDTQIVDLYASKCSMLLARDLYEYDLPDLY